MKLLAAISQHGLGHLAQAAPVLNALRRLHPALELTLWSGLSDAALRARIEGPFVHRHETADVGLQMHDAMRVDGSASHVAYQAFHADWPARVQAEADWLRAAQFDRVFVDVAYLPLAAAAVAGIPGIALCSLNWADICAAYLADLSGMATILEQMNSAYAAAEVFLQPTPAMPMPQLARRQAIDPIASCGGNQRQELIRKLALPTNSKLVLLGFGGVAYQGQGSLPRIDKVVWLTPDDWQNVARPDRIPFSRCGMAFIDLLASSDALITKVGYGSFVEAAAHGVPVLYLDRPDWPETPYLAEWLMRQANAGVIDETILFSSLLEQALQALWQQPPKPAIRAEGAMQAARRILAR